MAFKTSEIPILMEGVPDALVGDLVVAPAPVFPEAVGFAHHGPPLVGVPEASLDAILTGGVF